MLFVLGICVCLGIVLGHRQEPVEENSCFSRFDYEYKVIQKLVTLAEGQEKLEKTIEAQKQQLAEATERQQEMTKSIEIQKQQIAEADERYMALEKSMLEGGPAITLHPATKGKQVAFSAYGLKTPVRGLGTPTFHKYTVNTGSFDMETGVFTCPVAGQYLFVFSMEHSISTTGTVHCYFHVNKDGDVYVSARESANEAASVSVLYHLAVNDTVNLKCSNVEYLSHGYWNTVFTGILINQD